jgi:hypothetical protein
VVVVIMVAVMVLMMLFMLIPTVFATIFTTVLMTIFTTLLPALVLRLMAEVLLVVLTLLLADIHRLVFPGPYEVHLPVARMVLPAMQAPGPGVLGRNVQIQWLGHDHMRRRLLDDDRPGIDQRRRRPAIEVYTTIYTRRNLSLNGH